MDWMCGEGKGEKVKDSKDKRGVMDDPKVIGLRNGGVELASIQMGKTADKNRLVTEDEFKFWTCSFSEGFLLFLHPICKCWDSSPRYTMPQI